MTRREKTEPKCLEECEKHEKREANQRACINKAFEKIEHFDGSNPNKCLPWLEQIHAISNHYNREYHEELLLNGGGSITKTIHNIDIDATPEQIKDIVLHNHSNLKTPSQRLHAFNSIQQKPDKALQTYNSQHESHFQLAYPATIIDDAGSRAQCIKNASSLYGKLGDEMEGRLNQDLLESLQAAFEKAMKFEPRILTKQTINTRRMNEVNQIDVTNYDEDFKVNEAHIWNPNYKGKNYDPDYQNKNRNNGNNNNSSNSSSHSMTGYNKNYNNNGMSNTKNTLQDKPINVQVTLTGSVNREQLFKIQEVLRHPSQYRDKVPPNEQPATGEYTKSFNMFHPKKVEVNKATIDEVVRFGHFMRKSDAEVVEAIDIYKTFRDDIPYRQRISHLSLHNKIDYLQDMNQMPTTQPP